VRPEDGLTRSYSLASLASDSLLELHVAVRPWGFMSRWLTTSIGQPVGLRGPFGECCYRPDNRRRPLLLIGTGTGLAPLMGVLRDALTRGHSGPIRIYHGARNLDGLYLWQALLKLAKRHLNVHLEGWVVEPPLVSSHGIRVGRLGRGRRGEIALRGILTRSGAGFGPIPCTKGWYTDCT
jgi:NAD(P)H-flavin reductase